jgi:hypothetical protein
VRHQVRPLLPPGTVITAGRSFTTAFARNAAFARSQGLGQKGNRFCAVRVNCLDGVDPAELAEAPVKYFNMLHDDVKSPPAETRHL